MNRKTFAGFVLKDKHFWIEDRVYHALQIAFELIPSQPYGWISEKFLRRSLLQTLILAKKMQLPFKTACCTFAFLKILFSVRLIAAPQGGFIAPHVWEIVCRKNLTIFKGYHYSRFYIMISLSFWKMETKNLNLNPGYFNFLRTGNCIISCTLVIWTLEVIMK